MVTKNVIFSALALFLTCLALSSGAQAQASGLTQIAMSDIDYNRNPVSADDLIRGNEVVITRQAFKLLTQEPNNVSTYRAVVDNMNKAVFKSYNIDAKVICEKCSSGGTFTIGFYDMKLTGRGSDIQKLLLNQSKRKSSTVLWIGLGSPMNFIEVMSQFF